MEVLSSRTIIVTDDLARARAFYEGLLGLQVYREYGAAGTVTGVVLFLGGGHLELATGTATRAGEAVKLWLQVPDAHAEQARLVAAGVEIRKPAGRMPWGLDELWVVDPHGVELRVVTVPEDHPIRRRLD